MRIYFILNILFLVTQKIAEVFNVLTKFEAESPEKDAKFWEEIAELKVPLGEIFDESKFKKIKCLKFYEKL